MRRRARRTMGGSLRGADRVEDARREVEFFVRRSAADPSNEPLVPRTCSVSDTPCDTMADCPLGESCWGQGPVKGWRGQVAANGEWRRVSGAALDGIADGSTVAQAIVIDQ